MTANSPVNTPFDYIIIGAGSSGCVIANRLTENPANRVALLEAGPRDWNPWIHIPVGYFKTMHNRHVDWCFSTEPDPGINNRQIDWPRGKVLGGSSSLNGLLYVRGQPEDYDNWANLGCTGWSWQDVLPLFKRSEKQESGADEFHGQDGNLSVSNVRLQRPICDAWVVAAQEAGFAFNPDCNGASQEGVGYFQLTTEKGFRCSSAKAFLNPAKKRPNLTIITHAMVEKVLFDGKRATGVQYRDRSGTSVIINAVAEIILSAGSIGSPHILMHSGIGEAEELKAHDIKVIHDSSDVGKNLKDHLQARLVFKCNEPTLNDEVRSLFNQATIALQYALFRKGPMTMAASLAYGFMKTKADLTRPDIQFHVQPWSADSPGEGVHPFSAFTMSVCQLRPESHGEIKITSNNPLDYPKIYPNYLSTKLDCNTIVEGVKIARRIAKCEPLSHKISEGFRPDETLAFDDYDGTLDWARNHSSSIYHPTGTCRMGIDDRAVVDPQLRVKGIEGLRVADCSIMPEIVSGNTNAPAIMIGEKASDLILGKD